MENFYKKYDGTMDPYGSWQLEAYRMGPSTNPDADQLKEFNLDANWGTKNIEVGWLNSKKMESTPKPAIDEIRRLSKLTGVGLSVHGPLEDPTGLDQQGFNEYKRKGIVNQYFRAMEIAKETGGSKTPVVFHASNALPGKIYSKNGGKKRIESIGVIDQETGRFSAVVDTEKKETLEGTQEWGPEKQIEMLNRTKWSEAVRKLAIDRAELQKVEEIRNKNIRGKPLKNALEEDIRWSSGVINSMRGHINSQIYELYNDFSKFGPKKSDIDRIKDPYDREYAKSLLKNKEEYLKKHRESDKKIKEINKKVIDYYKQGKHEEAILEVSKQERLLMNDINNWQEFFGNTLKYGFIPERFAPVEDFSREKVAKTFADTAFKSYEKYGEDSPIVMIENPPPPQAFSDVKEHKRLIEDARKKLVEISREKGKPLSEKQASKLIQATLDVGHYGMWKQYGFKNKDIEAMSKEIAPYVGHVHISDNFGSSDAHLPPGWGNLPHEEVVKLLKERNYTGKTVIEAGGSEAMGYHPYIQSLEYFDSGLYSWDAGSSWRAVGDYFFGSSMYSAPGTPLPEVHSREYGGGFSGLPPASDSRKKSNLSGTPYS